jgi:hypothetical protein
VSAIGAASSGKAMSLEVLESNFRDDTVSNMVVMLLRMMTSAEIQRRLEFFAPFVLVRGSAPGRAPVVSCAAACAHTRLPVTTHHPPACIHQPPCNAASLPC